MRLALVTSLALLVGCATDPVDADPQEAFRPATVEATAQAATFPAFDLADVDPQVDALAARFVQVDVGNDPAPDVVEDARELQLRFAHGLAAASASTDLDAIDEVIELTWLGKGEVTDEPAEDETGLDLEDGDPPADPEAIRWVGFNGETRNEFELRLPLELAAAIGLEADRLGVPLGTPPSADDVPELQLTGLVGPNDTRVLKGTVDTRQSATNLKRMVYFSNTCSGTLVGRHHVVSAAHCIRRRAKDGNPAKWIQPTLYVGRNGSDWYDSADTSTGSRWFWVEADYFDAAETGGSPKGWDFGLIITPTRHIGSATGHFAWQASNVEKDDMLNRGYPGTPPPAPTGSDWPKRHLYGDLNYCNTGDYSTGTDSAGFSRFGYHSCDTSGGQSGSSLYRYSSGTGYVVRGVHKGAKNPAVTNSSDSVLFNSFALVTEDRSDTISWFHATYP